MNGALIIDKPGGITSHDVVAAVRRVTSEKRIGHAGTLDPLATGVLVLICGQATRLSRFLTASRKAYDATIVFGVTTDTFDIAGTLTSRDAARPTADEVRRAVAALRGEYLQMPPPFSAKKVAGTRAYELARQQKPIELRPAPVSVSRAEITGHETDRVTIELTCSAGFYVRSFAHSLGEALGCGACLEALRRTRSGDFTLADAIPLQRLQSEASPERLLIPMDRLLTSLRAISVSDEGRNRVAHGREITRTHVQREDSTAGVWRQDVGPGGEETGGERWVRVLDAAGHLVALAQAGDDDVLHPSIVLI